MQYKASAVMKEKTSLFPMAVVTRRTGLGPDVIRAWERRHQAIVPERSPGNHRLYSEEDIQRLILLRRALDAGWQIGRIADLPDEQIEKLLEPVAAVDASGKREDSDATVAIVDRCLQRIDDLDGEGLRTELDHAAVDLGRVKLIDGVLAGLMYRVGECCANGTLRIAHEHLASAAVRSFLGSLRAAYPVADDAPGMIVTTPAYQHHELAAMLVAATARSEGWRATYLGPNLPAEEIAAAAEQPGVRAVALSVTIGGSSDLDDELRRIGRLMPNHVRLVVGGRAAGEYPDALDAIGAVRVADLDGFREYLREER